MEETGCEIICGTPTALVVKGLMMMMMINEVVFYLYCKIILKHTVLSVLGSKSKLYL